MLTRAPMVGQVALAAAPLASGTSADASFRPVGGNLNVVASNNARGADVAGVAGVPYVALYDTTGGIGGPLRVRRLNGASWDFVGGEVSATLADGPAIADFKGQPWVTGTEFSQANGAYQVFVSQFDGTNWVRKSNSLNTTANLTGYAPDIATVEAGVSSMPYVVWSQFTGSDFEIRVARRKTVSSVSTWEYPGAALRASPGWSASYPRIAAGPKQGTTGVPYVAWIESSPPGPPDPVTGQPPPPKRRVHVARGNMVTTPSQSYWTVLGGQLNQNEDSVSIPQIAVVAGEPWVTWSEEVGGVDRVRVARYSGGSWQQVGQSSLNVDATKDARPAAIENVGGTAFVVMDQRFEAAGFKDRVWVMRFDGEEWVPVGGPVNIDPALAASGQGIADVAGLPYVAFTQYGDGSSSSQLRVAREQAPTCQASTVKVPHNALAFRISLRCDEGARRVVAGVSHGVLSDFDPVGGTVRYTPAANYSGRDSFRFASSDGLLESQPVTVSLDVLPTLARLTDLRISRKAFAVGRGPTPVSGVTAAATSGKAPRGTTFSFRLDKRADVTVTMRRARPGRKVGKRCLAPTPPRRQLPRCKRLVTVGTLRRGAHRGLNELAFSGRVGQRALPLGSYRAVFTANNAAGRSPAKRVAFRIVRAK